MRVLGITDGLTGGAAIIEDGKILGAVNEERLTRIKMAYGFPRLSIGEVFRLTGFKAEDIDKVVIATKNNYFVNEVKGWDGWFEALEEISLRSILLKAASYFGSFVKRFRAFGKLYFALGQFAFMKRRRKIRQILHQEFGIFSEVVFIDHHFAHACSAYFTSGYKDCLVVTLDGGGDGCSSHIYEFREGKFRKLHETSSYDSLGNYYSYITALSGFKAHKHEGKITGLAASGKPVYLDILNSFIRYQEGSIENIGGLVFKGALKGIKKRLPSEYDIPNLASSIQILSERIATQYVRYWVKKSGLKNIALAGGVVANVRINQCIHEIPEVEKIHIHPGMDDGGLAVGAALALSHPENQACMPNIYLGPDYSNNEIKKTLDEASLEAVFEDEIEKKVATLLAEGYVVARFNGKMEYGPRALGNRSILYQPTDPSVNDWLNQNLKRTEFMPFAPSTLYEYGAQCYENLSGALETARFMTITFHATEWMKENCPGVVHIDGTVRPQLVKKEENNSYYEIIDEFRKLTGLPTIINTSFNMHEEPIVCTPQDAVRAFLESNLDYLAIGNYLVNNTKPFTHILKPVKGMHKGLEK